MTALPVPDDKRCMALAKSRGEHCGNWAVRGSACAGWLGARAKQVQTKGQRRLAAQRVEAHTSTFCRTQSA